MSKHRIKLSKPVIRSRAEAEELLGEIRELKIQEQTLTARREMILKSIDEDFAPQLEPIAKALEEKSEVLRTWAEANASEFDGKKSLEMTHGVMGWRTGKHTIKTLSGWTFDRVLEKIKSMGTHFAACYVRVKEEVNKQQIIEDRNVLSAETLKIIGVKIVQDEPFFVEPKVTEVEKREIVEA